jgi:acyl dehydratase
VPELPATTPRVVDGAPRTSALLLKAALPLIPGMSLVPGLGRHGDEVPDLALVRHDVRVDPAHVASYAALCGFPVKDTLPVTYPHLLAFPLHLAIMTDGSFPFPAVGTLHLDNSLTQHRPLDAREPLQVTARSEHLRPHPKGRVFDLRTTVHSAGELVWEEVSTFLRRGPGTGSRQARPTKDGLDLPDATPGTVAWRLPADLGRRYAAVSGDHNPIHLYGLTAKAFGFPRQVAHGMWSLARCVAAVENRLPDAVRVDVAFKKPVLLPGTVSYGTTVTDGVRDFALTRPKDGAPHLVGRAAAAR